MGLVKEIRSELAALETSPKALRKFAWVVGGVFGGLTLYIRWKTGFFTPGWQLLGGSAALLLLIGTGIPRVLRPLYLGWMGLAFVLGFFMTRVLLTLVFFLVVSPIGLVMRLLGKDLLDKKIDQNASTYWKPRTTYDPSPKRLERYF